MTEIKLKTEIKAPISEVFDLARSIDLHKGSMSKYQEEAIGGVTSGLINLGETVTWKAKHFGVTQKLTSIITEMESPHLFSDEMVNGAFKWFKHTHRFQSTESGTIMVDTFQFEAPLGFIGRLFSKLILKKYMSQLLEERNAYLKKTAEAQTND